MKVNEELTLKLETFAVHLRACVDGITDDQVKEIVDTIHPDMHDEVISLLVYYNASVEDIHDTCGATIASLRWSLQVKWRSFLEELSLGVLSTRKARKKNR